MSEAPPLLLDAGQRHGRVWQAAAIAALLGVAAVTDSTHPLPFEVCLFHRLTALPCPTCGMTRAVCHAVHGHWAQSIAWHPAGLILAAGLAGRMLWAAAEAWRGQPIAGALRCRLAKALLIAGVAASLVNWVAQLTGW